MSTNHTPHFNLSQWQASDQVLRTEFNVDNAKIDAALAGKLGRIEPIDGLTVTQKSFSADVQLPTIDWSEWEIVALTFFPNEPYRITSDSYMHVYPIPESGSFQTHSSSSISGFSNFSAGTFLQLFFPMHSSETKITGVSLAKGGGFGIADGPFSAISYLQVGYVGSGGFPTGTFKLWGIR